MITLQDEWRQYRDKVYPDGIPAIQNKECHQAFFAGAFVALQVVKSLATNDTQSEEQAMAHLGKLFNEAEGVCEQCVSLAKGRN